MPGAADGIVARLLLTSYLSMTKDRDFPGRSKIDAFICILPRGNEQGTDQIDAGMSDEYGLAL